MTLKNKFSKLNQSVGEQVFEITRGLNGSTFLEGVTKAITNSPEKSSIEKLLKMTNSRLAKKYNIVFNPFESESVTKFFNGCDSCVSLSDVVVRICQSYGCVAESFVQSTIARDCSNQKIFSRIGTQETNIGIQASGSDVYQTIHPSTDEDNCGDMTLFPVNLQENISQQAMCSCTPFDAVVEAAELLAQQYARVYDKSILYGNRTGSTYSISGQNVTYPFVNTGGGYTASAGLSNTQFQSINPNLVAGNFSVIAGVDSLYTEITKMLARIQFGGSCGNTVILMTRAMASALHGMKDTTGRPILSETSMKGDFCNGFSIACTPVVICDAPEEFTVGSVRYSDVWIGSTEGYAFSKFVFTEPSMIKSQTSTGYFLQATQYAGGKLLKPEKFARITVPIA